MSRATSSSIDLHRLRHLPPGRPGRLRRGRRPRLRPPPARARRRPPAARLHALLSAPPGRSARRGADRPASALDDFPLPVEGPVFYCGFNSPKSYGGNSYFVRHPEGNWLIDSPKFLPRLVRRFERTRRRRPHLPDAQRRRGRRRALRRALRQHAHHPPRRTALAARRGAWSSTATSRSSLPPDFLAIPTPGHTAGHCVLLFRERFLFTGDHLAWDRHGERLEAHRDYCWYSWPQQAESMAAAGRLAVRVGACPATASGFSCRADEMRRHMQDLVARMRAPTGT